MEITRTIGQKGQVVIPMDIRKMLGLKPNSEIMFKIENNEVTMKPKKDRKMWLADFLKYRKKGGELALKDLKKIEDESYDLP